MPQSPHNRIAELHHLAAHAHTAAAVAHGKGDHPTAHELTRAAHEHSRNAFQYEASVTNAAGAPEARSRARSGHSDAGDLEGLSATADAGDESVRELADTGQAFEANALTGVESAANHPERSVQTHQDPRSADSAIGK
jgi:hypothetical protein